MLVTEQKDFKKHQLLTSQKFNQSTYSIQSADKSTIQLTDSENAHNNFGEKHMVIRFDVFCIKLIAKF